MQRQIRITRTKEIDKALQDLQKGPFYALDEAEIFKYLISKAWFELKSKNNLVFDAEDSDLKKCEEKKDVFSPKERSREEKTEMRKILAGICKEGRKAGDRFLKKRGLKLEDLNEDQLYDLVKNA